MVRICGHNPSLVHNPEHIDWSKFLVPTQKVKQYQFFDAGANPKYGFTWTAKKYIYINSPPKTYTDIILPYLSGLS